MGLGMDSSRWGGRYIGIMESGGRGSGRTGLDGRCKGVGMGRVGRSMGIRGLGVGGMGGRVEGRGCICKGMKRGLGG